MVGLKAVQALWPEPILLCIDSQQTADVVINPVVSYQYLSGIGQDVKKRLKILVTFLRFLHRCMECRRGLAMRIMTICLSVRPSVKRVHCDKMEERSDQIFITHKRQFSLDF